MSDNFFKFIYREHAPSYAGDTPTLWFGRLKYYRLLERLTGDDRIGDLYEGTALTHVDRITSDDADQSQHEILRRAGAIDIGGLGNTVENFTVINEVDAFVFCLSYDEFEAAADVFARQDDDSYDAALKISDIGALTDEICAGTVSGTPVTELFDIYVREVHYDREEIYDLNLTMRVESGDPFRKRNLYAGQKEFRFALIPKAEIADCDHIQLQLRKDASRLFEPIEVRGSSRIEREIDTPSLDDLKAHLRELLIDWDAIDAVNRMKMHHLLGKQDELLQVLAEHKTRFRKYSSEMIKLYYHLRRHHRDNSLDSMIVHNDDNTVLAMLFERYLRRLDAL